jgi:hypothetical protein
MPAASIFRDYAMAYIGLSNSALIPANASARMMQDFNAALQEIFANVHRNKVSLQVRAPTAVTIGQVTNGSTAITFSGFADWMLGCTVVISGDGLQNQFELDGATCSLNAPYQGTTASNVSAVVYQDALNTTTEVKAVYPPSLLNNQYFVDMLDSRSAMVGQSALLRDNYSLPVKPVRRPQSSILEDSLPYMVTPTTRISFDSLPDTSYIYSFEAELAAPRITTWADTRTYFMPGNEDESILFPWALFKFMSWPQFLQDPSTRNAVAQAAQSASARWKSASKGFTNTSIDATSW